jgi:hypothetical protein
MKTEPAQIGSLPIISLADRTPAGETAAAEQLRQAATTIGFFYIRDHGVPQALIDATFVANREFHALSAERKLEVRLTTFHRGYQPFASSTLRSSARCEPAKHPNQLVEPGHFGRGAGFVDKDQVVRSPFGLPRPPLLARFRNVGAVLLCGALRLFLSVSPR